MGTLQLLFTRHSSLHSKKQPPARKGSNDQQSFWKPEEVVALFRQEALAALQEDAAARQLSPGIFFLDVQLVARCPFLPCQSVPLQLKKMQVLTICSRATQTWQVHRRTTLRWKIGHATAHCSKKTLSSQVQIHRHHHNCQLEDPPRTAHVSEDIGLLGFFADIAQQTQPPREELG